MRPGAGRWGWDPDAAPARGAATGGQGGAPEVAYGGCNGCEADGNVLNTVVFDRGRFGIQFVASPRHADGLLITGPVTRNMELALRKTWEAVPQALRAVAQAASGERGGMQRVRG